MIDAATRPHSAAPRFLLLVPASIVIAAACIAVVALQQAYFPLSLIGWIGCIAGSAVVALLVFGPSRLIVTVLFLLALLDHQFRSFAIAPLAGVEWHPRELLLLLLFAHGAVKVVQHRPTFRWTPLHFGMLLYTTVFVYAAWRGLWLGEAPRDIIAECRAPLFLGAFWVLALTVRSPRDLHYYGNLALCVLVVVAAATVAAFAWFALMGPIPNTQNALGEFVPRTLGGLVVQSIRPSGHAWLEAGFVVALGLLLCRREPWYRKALYVLLVPLFGAAIAAGMMRTAAVSVGVSVVVLLWLNLPRAARGLTFAIAVFVIGAGCFAWLASQGGAGGPIAADASLAARAVETRGALEALREYPLFGAGFGASFEGLGLARQDSGSSAIPVDYHSLHNAWLYIAWKAGLVGLALVVVALGAMLAYSQHIVNRLPSMNARCLGRALQAVLAGQLVASVAMPRITYASGGLFLAVWAMAFVLLARKAEKTQA